MLAKSLCSRDGNKMHSFRTLVKFNHIGKNRITSGPNLEIFHQESSFRMVLQKSVWKRKAGAIHLSLWVSSKIAASHHPTACIARDEKAERQMVKSVWSFRCTKKGIRGIHLFSKFSKLDFHLNLALLGALQPYDVYRFSGDFILGIICMTGFLCWK